MRSELRDPIRSVHSADDVADALEHSAGRGGTSLVVVDPEVRGGLEVIQWLKGSRYRRIPLLVICDDKNCEDAYERGANGVLQRAWWADQTERVASAVGHFWLGLARLPAIPELGETQSPQRFLKDFDPL